MKKLVFLTGAGMSAESGIQTFRGSGGMWEEYPVMQVASHEGWLADPNLVTEFYNKRRKELFSVKPNEGHRLVAALEKQFDVTVVTQNVDNLHEMAGSTKVIHLHGELTKVCSSRDTENPAYWQTLTPDDYRVEPGTKAGDGSLLRPYIVFFGESVPMMEAAAEAAMKADVFVIIGTSLNVYPAAGLVQYVPRDTPIYLIDPEEVMTAAYRDVTFIKAGASEGMRRLCDMI